MADAPTTTGDTLPPTAPILSQPLPATPTVEQVQEQENVEQGDGNFDDTQQPPYTDEQQQPLSMEPTCNPSNFYNPVNVCSILTAVVVGCSSIFASVRFLLVILFVGGRSLVFYLYYIGRMFIFDLQQLLGCRK